MPILGVIASSMKGAPGIPTIGTATDVGTGRAYNNGAATVTFTPGAGATATSFTATSSPGGFTGTAASSPITVAGLQSGVSYTFTVTATNASGTSAASSASNSITATTVPQAPTIGTASVTNSTTVSLSFTAGATGGKTISSYTATSSPSISLSTSGTSTPLTITGSYALNQAYTFTITATNANGTSTASGASNSVTPSAQLFLASDYINQKLVYSSDGINWSNVASGINTTYFGQGNIFKGPDYYINFANQPIGAGASSVAYSTNCATWTVTTLNATASNNNNAALYGGAYVLGKYTVLGYPGVGGDCYAMTSTTGTAGTWSQSATISGLGSDNNPYMVAGPATGAAVIYQRGLTPDMRYTSTNITGSFTNVTDARATYIASTMQYINGNWVLTHDDGVSYSSNGTTFTASSGTQSGFGGLAFGNNTWLVGGSSAVMYTSSNLSTWSTNTITAAGSVDLCALVYGAGLFVVFPRQPHNFYYTSSVGTGSWTQRNLPIASGRYGMSLYA